MENSTEKNSIVRNLFYGEINEDHAFPYPKFTEEQKEMALAMTDAVDKYAQDNIDSEKFDEEAKIPPEVIQGLAELGLCGLAVEEEYGGMELDYTLYSRVFSQVCAIDGAIATTLGAHQSIGYRALINEGTDEQKRKWLPKLASGEVIAAFCLTEPGSGSDAYSIKTKAVDNGDGTFTITGQKLWITNGGMAGFYTVYCKTDHEIDGKTVEKISCFVVEKDMEGVSFGEAEKKMGIKASETRAVYLDKVVVPASNMLGQPGKGFKIAMNVLNTGRLSLGSGAVGGIKSVLKLATEHAKGRKQFGKSISEFGLIQDKLSQMAALCYASESMVYYTTGHMVQGQKDFSIESAICKVYCSEALWKAVDMGMQIAAGNGYMKEYPYERMMRDARINLIFEGTNEILRCLIALSGFQGPSEDLKELGKVTDVSAALSDPIKSFGLLTGFAKKRVERIIGATVLEKVHPDLEEHATNFATMLDDFPTKVENALIKYGKKIITHELPQKRIADMTMDLYLTVAVLARTTQILEDEKISDSDKEYVKSLTSITCRDARYDYIHNSKAMESNYDSDTVSASNGVCERDGYGLDIINF